MIVRTMRRWLTVTFLAVSRRLKSTFQLARVRQINGEITLRAVEEPRYEASPKFVVNDVRAASDDALANRLLSGRLR